MPIARHPPHRPVLALLTHTVPTLDTWRRSARWDRGVGHRPLVARHRGGHRSVPKSSDYADCAAEAGAATYVAPCVGTSRVAPSCPEPHGIGNTPEPQTVTTSPCSRSTRAGAISAALEFPSAWLTCACQ